MRKSVLFLAALTMLTIGCDKEGGSEGDKPSGENTKVSATIADNDALTWWGGQSVFLNVGDKAYTYNGTEPANPASFEGASYSVPAVGLFGAYVGEQTTSITAADASMTFTVPSEWTYDPDHSPLGTMVAYSKDSNLEFHNLEGFLSFKLYGDVELEGPQPCLESIVVYGAKGEAVSGEVTVKFTSGGAVKGVTYNSTGETSITMDMSETPVQLDPSTPVEIVIPFAAGSYENGIYFVVNTDDGNYMKRTEELVTVVERGEVTSVPEYVFIADPKPINLSSNGHANCYIIPQDATAFYSFDATVIGNGDEGLFEGAHVTSTKIAPKGAKILWKIIGSSKLMENNDGQPIKTSSVKIDRDGMVTFNTHSMVGNAVIAVYDNEECTGKPLWSWLFWKPEGGLEAIKDIAYNGTYTLMDRNLGAGYLAKYPDEVSGLYFQWGRKDPFYHANGIATSSRFTLVENKVTDGDIAYTVANPTTYITSTGAANFLYNDWLPDAMQDSKLWGAKKTIYDPCPAGYRVADPEAFADVVSATPTLMPNDGTGGGTHQLQYTLGGVSTQFPCSGYLLYDAGKRHDRNKSGRIWTVAPGTADATKSQAFSYITTGATVEMIEAERALALPVRCQKIK